MTFTQIEELASGENVKKDAVVNFLISLDGLSYQEAVGNAELDARSYRWTLETLAAIKVGLLKHYFPDNG